MQITVHARPGPPRTTDPISWTALDVHWIKSPVIITVTPVVNFIRHAYTRLLLLLFAIVSRTFGTNKDNNNYYRTALNATRYWRS